MNISGVHSATVRSATAEHRPEAVCHLLRVETDSGHVSFGEALVPTRQHLAEAVELFEQVLVGAEVRDRAVLWERLSRTLLAEKWPLAEYIGALSAADLALWDLAAKSYEVSLYQLLGGAHFRAVDTYLLLPQSTSEPRELLSWLASHHDQAVGGVGLSLPDGSPQNLRIVRQARKQVGPSHRLVMRLEKSCSDLAAAEAVAGQLAKAEVFWAENILPGTMREECARLRGSTDIPLAAGRDLYALEQFDQLVRSQAVDVVTVDLRRCGGLTVARRVADLVRLAGIHVAFTGGISPLTTLAAAHLSAHCPVAMPIGLPANFVDGRGDLFTTSAQLSDGFLHLSDAPGVGGELELSNWEVQPDPEVLDDPSDRDSQGIGREAPAHH